MCCAVGHNAKAATAAIRARINHFRETEFVAYDGQPIMGAQLYAVNAWGEERIRLMLRSVLGECLSAVPEVRTEEIGLMVMTTSVAQHGLPSEKLVDELNELTAGEVEGFSGFYPQSLLCTYGKGGIARALDDATQWLNQENGPRYVMLIGVDTLLHAAAIEHYLIHERLVVSNNADGFIPAEGAGALLLTQKRSSESELWIDAWASAEEAWRIDGEQPMRAEAMTKAVRQAISLAGTELAALNFHASGMNGESWYAKEISLTLSRVLERRVADFPHYMVAQNVGETGAASPILTLAWLVDLMGRTSGHPGANGLLHFSDEPGSRSALIVRYRSADTKSG
jgi:3-oxoacyl-[acyl-carrier-protein] synthase-1